MEVKYINPFLNSFGNIIPQLGLNNIEKKGIKIKSKHIESPGVAIIVGLVGDIKGNIIYGMNEENAKKIASIMMMGMPVDEFDELAQSAISELSNMLTANAATNFSHEGINVDISTPTLIKGNFVANVTTENVISVMLSLDGMEVEVNISLNVAN